MTKINWPLAAWVVFSLAAGATVALCGPDHKIIPAANMLAIMNMIAGVMIAALLAVRPISLAPGSWRHASIHRRAVRRFVYRTSLLLAGCIAAGFLNWCAQLVPGNAESVAAGRIAIGTGASVMLLVFLLPYAAQTIIIAEMDLEVDARKENLK